MLVMFINTSSIHSKTELNKCILKTILLAGCQWLMPVILATQEAEIRRISVQSQLGHNSLQDPTSEKTFTKKGWWSGSRCRS
jgi:hypothetical protein